MSRFSKNGGHNGRPQGNDRFPPVEENSGSDSNGGSGGREPPAASIIHGRLRAVVWANKTKDDGSDFFTVSLSRSYKDQQGNWKQATTFSRDDLPALALLAQEAYHRVIELSGGR